MKHVDVPQAEAGNYSADLYDPFGRRIRHVDFDGKSVQLSMEHVPPGIYTIIISGQQQKLYFEKILKL